MGLKYISLCLALSAALSVSSFSLSTPHYARRATFLSTSTSTSAEFELPDDNPNKRSKKDSTQSRSSRDLETPLSPARRERYELEDEAKQRFVLGDDLHALRQQVLALREDLKAARKMGASDRVHRLERSILKAQQRDAEFVYSVSKERRAVAEEAGLHDEAKMWKREADMARSVLPQFNLDGLWVGKYSENGFEMINVTYTGANKDILIAYKVTGKKNVPKGEVTFQVDLSDSSKVANDKLAPIELSDKAARQWGSRFLHRFAGRGQVSAEGYRNSQWMEGHLILVNEYFSFAWLPIGHQVFFGRPSAELTLKLMKESQYNNSDDRVRQFLTKCLEETESLEDEMEFEDGPFSSHNQQDYYNQQGCFE